MLQPDHRVLLTEALRPPAGFSVDHAIATTYSLSLTATLIAPMTFAATAMHDLETEAEQPSMHMLDAVQRYVNRTTVFVQAGGIHVPQSHSRVLAFLEDSIHEVEPPEAFGSFHPKIWAVRYRSEAEQLHHRLIISSRNLTLDNSWDTILVLDEDPAGVIDAQPAGDFLKELPDLTVHQMTQSRRDKVVDLATSLTGRFFATPPEYRHGQLLPLGIGPRHWDFPTETINALVISPFLSSGRLDAALPTRGEAILVSRAESMDELGQDQLIDWQTRVLHPALDDPVHDEVSEDETAFEQLSGLHAKTAVYDLANDESVTVTGSANCTNAAWQQNIEFTAVLYGPTASTGTAAILGQEDTLGLASIIEPYEPAQREAVTDAEQQLRWEIEQFHRHLARTKPVLDLTIIDQQTVSVQLRLTAFEHTFGSNTRLWLSTTPGDQRLLSESRPWEVAPVNVTSFLAVETTVGSVTRSCILMCRLTGEAIDRRQAVLAALLSSPDRVLQYIELLLGVDTPSQATVETQQRATGITLPTPGAAGNTAFSAPVLFEPLMLATRDPQQLAQIAGQIEELRALPAADELIPPEFLAMWDTVVAATLPGGST